MDKFGERSWRANSSKTSGQKNNRSMVKGKKDKELGA